MPVLYTDRNRLPDVVSTFKDFFFTSVVKRSAGSFAIVDDSILEFDELFRAEFGISSLVEDGWKARKGQFPIAYIAIEDDDCELRHMLAIYLRFAFLVILAYVCIYRVILKGNLMYIFMYVSVMHTAMHVRIHVQRFIKCIATQYVRVVIVLFTL